MPRFELLQRKDTLAVAVTKWRPPWIVLALIRAVDAVLMLELPPAALLIACCNEALAKGSPSMSGTTRWRGKYDPIHGGKFLKESMPASSPPSNLVRTLAWRWPMFHLSR